MRIERLGEEERKQALTLARQAVADLTGSSAARIEEFLEQHTARFEMSGAFEEEMKGFIAYDPESLRIFFLAVKEEYRNQGTASALLDNLRDLGTKKNLSRIEAGVPAGLRVFFMDYGFEQTGEAAGSGELSVIPMEYLLGRQYLGKTVTVTVDRPYGSFHPHNPDVLYPLNFGYVDELVSDDGEFQDAWVYGPEEPVETFTGTVCGIIYHKDGPSRFIVTRIGETADPQAIMHAVAFDEQYYDTRFIWASSVN